MKSTLLYLIITFLLSCTHDSYSDLVSGETTVNLRWNKAYNDDSIDKSLIGLKWALSYMGATLPTSNTGFNVTGNIITINIKYLGFSNEAQQKLLKLSEKIKQTEEYQTNQSIDLGRFVALLLGASEHYYNIIGTPDTLNAILTQYTLLPQKGYVNNSSVSLEHRIIRFSEQNGFNQLFLSEEVDPVTGEIYEYETIELLPNGQLRFGIFDTNGNRKNSADALHSGAGKPAKCMWCHESGINQMFNPQNDYAGYLTYADFQSTLIGYRDTNRTQKLALTDGVDFAQTQQHTLTELLYISFMEPSAERLSLEWNMPLAQVQSLLSGLPTHVYAEFPFLGNLYHRGDVEALAPYQGLTVSTNIREYSPVEVNHLND
ncbi:hypothetical protein [Flavobacterium sedimenticola]|uniref:Uncharacterized protein n=1 Tax=Flavobacterium sedimenticola TaxID=3043286 RepID=A0ABT6XL76_9FLAO|nr:hypothetical protein [Flavobacterium sedimenticola]MDI9255836.1 hypothetical protein [Flavobacterium sedimenticola]